MIFDVEEELDWYHVEFTFKMYPGETFEDTDNKVISSLNHFPMHLHSSDILKKERTGDWRHLIKLTVALGLVPGVDIEQLMKMFDNVTHLQKREFV